MLSLRVWRAVFAGLLVVAQSASAAPPHASVPPGAGVAFAWESAALVDEHGKAFTLGEHRGKLLLLSFFFTHCAGICAPQTQQMSEVWSKLDAETRARVVFASVTVDPANDTPEKLAAYKKRFGITTTSWRFATGKPEVLTALSTRFGSLAHDEQPAQHRPRLYLVGPTGSLLLTYSAAPVDTGRVARELAEASRTLTAAVRK